ncbi:MAG: DUF922 domain-containing protein [Sphingomonas sp.]
MKRPPLILWLVLAAVAARLAVPSSLAAQDLDGRQLADIPGVTLLYYDVSGDTAEAIRASINSNRPSSAKDHQAYDALSAWRIAWNVRGKNGVCDPSTATVSFNATVLLPRLANHDDLHARLRKRWDAYYAALLQHEAGHVGYAQAHASDVEAALRAASCATLNSAGRAAIAVLGQHETAYDAQTNHGLATGAAFP